MQINDDRKQYNMKEAIRVENSLAHEGTEKYIHRVEIYLQYGLTQKKKKKKKPEEKRACGCPV